MDLPAQPPRIEDLLAHSEWLRGLARELVADSGVAEQIVQDTWVVALRRPPSLTSNLRGWLATVLRNQARDWAREERNLRAREQKAAREEAVAAADEVAARADTQRFVIEHVMALDEVYRTVLLKRFYDNMEPQAIATMQGVPLATVKTRLARGLEKLRAKLDASKGGRRSEWALTLVPILHHGAGRAVVRQGRASTSLRTRFAAATAMVIAGTFILGVYLTQGSDDLNAANLDTLAQDASAKQAPSLPAPPISVLASDRTPVQVNLEVSAAEPDQALESVAPEVELAPVTVLGQGVFSRATDSPRAITLDPTGTLYAIEYGEEGRCVRFDRTGASTSLKKDPIGYCSEALIAGGWLFVTRPKGELVRLNPVTLGDTRHVPVGEPSKEWLCNSMCAVNEKIHVATGDNGRIHIFDLDLQPVGVWDAGIYIEAMDSAGETLFLATRNNEKSSVLAYAESPEGLMVRLEPDLDVAGQHVTDLCALDKTQLLVVNESGEILQYECASSAGGDVKWILQGRTDLAAEPWFTEPNSVTRAVYDARAETLYLSFIKPDARIVAVPYSTASASRVKAAVPSHQTSSKR